MADFLQLIEDLIVDLLKLMDAVFDLLLDLIKAVIGIADQILTQPLDQLPLIGTLLKAIEDISDVDFGDVTLVSLVSLILAIPITVAYKLIHGADDQPFPNPLSTDPQALKFANAGAVAMSTLIGVARDFFPADTPVPQLVNYLFYIPSVASKGLTWPG